MHRIGLYAKTSNQAMSAVCKGAEAIGLRPFFRNPKAFDERDTEDFDAVVALGLAGRSRLVRDTYRAKGIPVFIIDAGYILRDCGYSQFGIGDLNWLPDAAYHDRAEEMVLFAQNKRKQGSFILVAGQLPGDNQHSINVIEWRDKTLGALKELTDLPVCFRPHPRVERPQNTISEALEDCHCLVTHNSTAAYEAIRQGIPVICDPCAAYSEVCETRLENVNAPKIGTKAKRQKMLDRVAYAQWTLEELETGEPLKFLIEQLEGEAR